MSWIKLAHKLTELINQFLKFINTYFAYFKLKFELKNICADINAIH